jgi:phage shock protein C
MKRLCRSETNKRIVGVCGGIGEMLDLDPTIVRLLFIVFMLATGFLPFVIGYLIAWWIVPTGKQKAQSPPPVG